MHAIVDLNSGSGFIYGAPSAVCNVGVRINAHVDAALEAGLRLIHGKRMDAELHPARVRRLGAAGAEIESKAPVAVFGALQLVLAMEPALALDGKVIELTERDGIARALVRFTGLDWDTRARIETYARERRPRGYDPGSKP